MSTHLVAPSILAADFANLEREVKMINESQADWIHVDVMDGVFVPNFSLGIPVVEALKRHAKKPLDVHLMIVNPEHHVEAFRKLVPIIFLCTWRFVNTCKETYSRSRRWVAKLESRSIHIRL
jgi:ribulose-phosphate 3-epimerase